MNVHTAKASLRVMGFLPISGLCKHDAYIHYMERDGTIICYGKTRKEWVISKYSPSAAYQHDVDTLDKINEHANRSCSS